MRKAAWFVGVAVALTVCLLLLVEVSDLKAGVVLRRAETASMLAQSLPGKLLAGQVQLKLASGAVRRAGLETQAQEATAMLLNQDADLAGLRDKSIGVLAETTVAGKGTKGDECKTETLFLLKESYTAQMVEVSFSMDAQGKVTGKSINKNFRPTAGAIGKQVERDAKLEGDKGKEFSFQERNLRGENPPTNLEQESRKAEDFEKAQEHHSWWYARGLANTACTSFPSAVTATTQVNGILSSAFAGSSARRVGSQSTEAEITNFLKYDYRLVAWNNIGHGATSASDGAPCYALVQWNSSMYYNEFASMTPYRGLYWCVVLTNSCNSNRNPLKAAIMTRRPRTYIGGNILLPVNRSEWVDVQFWYRSLLRSPRMTMAVALSTAQAYKGMAPGSFGLTGYSSYF